jgi:uncharacterized protein
MDHNPNKCDRFVVAGAGLTVFMPDITTIAEVAAKARTKGPPPVHLWNPPYCGDIGMRIAADGTWYYQGTPIGRPAMVKLFASILRKDPERHVLVTPVEMVGITVDDAPFIAVDVTIGQDNDQPLLTFQTNVEDSVTASMDHPIRFEPEPTGGLRPYVLVRGGLWAKASRRVYLELVEQAVPRMENGVEMLGVESGGTFFAMAPMSAVGDLA